MGKKPKFGICKLCGKYTVLTYEHVPPKAAFNDTPVKQISGNEAIKSLGEDRLPWDLSNLYGTIQQRGKGEYYLCHSCNENTGSWYVPYFVRFIRGIFYAISSTGGLENETAIQLSAESIRPLPLFKEIMVMFCNINHNCFGDENLRSFLLDRNSNAFDSKRYRVFCYIAKGPVLRMNGLSVACYTSSRKETMMVTMSEITATPLGFALYIDLPEGYEPQGCEITPFSNCRYEETAKCEMLLPVLESNIMFSGDYRTKEEIEATVEQNERYNNTN